jgi:hypothetical protein
MSFRVFIISFLLCVTVSVCYAERPFEQRGITMLQTEKVFFERVPGMGAFEVYVKQLVDAVDGAVAKVPKSTPAGGFLVVAVKPDGRSRVWLDVAPPLTHDAAMSITSAAQQVYPVTVKKGVVLFAVKISLWGGKPPQGMVPRPQEWEAEADKVGGPIELADLVLRVWPD